MKKIRYGKPKETLFPKNSNFDRESPEDSKKTKTENPGLWWCCCIFVQILHFPVTKKIRFLLILLLLILPVISVVLIDPASTLSLRNFFENIFGTVFFIDLPIGMCLLHYYYPQFFQYHKGVPCAIAVWTAFFLVCWGIVAVTMFLEIQFGRYPENGFAVVCAYLFGWSYILFTMIPIGLLYLLLRLIQKLWRKRDKT